MSPDYQCFALRDKAGHDYRILPIIRACDIPQPKHHRHHRRHYHHDHNSHKSRYHSSSEVLCETTSAQREVVYRNDDGSVRKTVFFDTAGNPSIVIYNPESPVARGLRSGTSSACSSAAANKAAVSERPSSASSETSVTDTSTTASSTSSERTNAKTEKDENVYSVRYKSAGSHSSSSSSVSSAKHVKVVYKDVHGGVASVSYRNSRGRERTVVYDE